MPASHAIAKSKGGRPKGSTSGVSSSIRLRDIFLSGYTADQIHKWFDALPPKEKIDALIKLEPKEIVGAGGGPLIVKWAD